MKARQIKRDTCQAVHRISKSTILAIMANVGDEGTPNNPLNPAVDSSRPYILRTIPLDHWDVISFDPSAKQVCIALYVYDIYGHRTGDKRVIVISFPDNAFNPGF